MKKNLTDGYVLVAPGNMDGEKLNSFYISSTEISNKQYREFMTDLLENNKADELKQAIVDSSKWHYFGFSDSNPAFANYYFQHKDYNDFPVVNITKLGAELYCKWLTDKYNRKAKQKIKFLLPTEKQWMLAARGGNGLSIYPWEGNSITYTKRGKYMGEKMCNYKFDGNISQSSKGETRRNVAATVVSYMPNAFGIYNMSGNVSELIADKDFTKGGSWNSVADKVKITSSESYSEVQVPSPVVGFRPIFVLE